MNHFPLNRHFDIFLATRPTPRDLPGKYQDFLGHTLYIFLAFKIRSKDKKLSDSFPNA